MAAASSIVGFADFLASLPLPEVAKRLSAEMFAGIRFSDDDDGSWDEVPCLHLERDFLGLRVVLGGSDSMGYTLELSTTLRSICASDEATELPAVCDVSEMLKNQLARIPGISLSSPNEVLRAEKVLDTNGIKRRQVTG
ncbi:MAG: hypothetical protein ACHQ50_16495 [Fimbriimonadales bacterium]